MKMYDNLSVSQMKKRLYSKQRKLNWEEERLFR